MSVKQIETSFMKQWTELKATDRNHNTVLWCCAHVLKWPLIGVMPLRIALLAFTFCQPLLLQSLLSYLGQSGPTSPNVGHGLISAYVFVYLGMAVSTNIYWYFHLRTITKLRACLVTAISRHTSAVNIHLLEDPQSPLTLMSNDVERTVQGIRYLHEVWANAVQACLATYILERQAGAACVVSVGITVLTSAAVVYITSTIGSKQHKWMEAIQKRTAAISDLLSSIKGVKMKGLEDRFYNIIDSLRSQDIKCGNKFRMVMTYTAGLSFVPEFLCPFLPFIVLVLAPNISGSTFDATKIFTILSALLVLTQPLTNGFQILPAVLAGVGSLKRIGTFLLADEQL
jgi:ATP-binding cassette subfamily C (CFTR/MRP) protein 1